MPRHHFMRRGEKQFRPCPECRPSVPPPAISGPAAKCSTPTADFLVGPGNIDVGEVPARVGRRFVDQRLLGARNRHKIVLDRQRRAVPSTVRAPLPPVCPSACRPLLSPRNQAAICPAPTSRTPPSSPPDCGPDRAARCLQLIERHVDAFRRMQHLLEVVRAESRSCRWPLRAAIRTRRPAISGRDRLPIRLRKVLLELRDLLRTRRCRNVMLEIWASPPNVSRP